MIEGLMWICKVLRQDNKNNEKQRAKKWANLSKTESEREQRWGKTWKSSKTK